jgi:hypothetical protein
VQEVLNGDYVRYPLNFDARVSLQGRLASEAFKAISSRHVPVTKLAQALANAAKGRHVLAWSADPVVESLWKQVGATGSIADDDFLVAVENVAANKMDWYVNPTVEMTSARQADATTKVTLDLTIANPTVQNAPAYVLGDDFKRGKPGQYRAMVAFYLPNQASTVGSVHGFYAGSFDGPMKVALMELVVPMGSSETVEVTFLLPAGLNAVNLIPSARARPMTYSINGTRFDDAVSRTVSLRPPALPGTAPAGPGAAPATSAAGQAPATTVPATTAPPTTAPAPACPTGSG